jgi:8-amino-7-oxononanoate synthase
MSRNRFQQRLLTSLNALQAANQRRTRQLTERPGPVSCRLFGRDFVSFATNDYLGLCHDPRVCLAFSQAAADQAGSGASALIAGRSVALCQLEETLADWEGTESSLVFPSGFAANIGTIMSLAGSRDAIFCDRDNHASLIDGCRGSAAKFLVYDRTRLDQLRTSIARRRSEFDLVFIVTDTVFSMDGTLADLNSLCDLADEFDGLVIADEAHATGIFGQHGRGVCEAQGVEDRVSVRLGTLSKSIGSLGGFAAGSQALCDWLWNSARSQFFSTALPPAVCAAATRSLQILREEPERRESGVALMKVGEAECAETLNPVESPIAGVLVGDDALAVQVSRQLQERGFLIPAIRPPTVPPKTARLRLSISSEHTETQIEEAAEAISQVLASVR